MFHEINFYIGAILLVLSAVAIAAVIKLSRELKQNPPTGDDADKKRRLARAQMVVLFVIGMGGELIALAILLKTALAAIMKA